ncbi:MAG: beta-propeller domain-containing protein [Candidatus Woesearchaeota archaeon]
MKHALSVLLLLSVVIVAVGCEVQNPALPQNQNLNKFNSSTELQAFLQDSTQDGGNYDMLRSGVSVSAMESKSSAPAPQTSGTQSYSGTNNQYTNVDEGDFVKNDNKYIYTIANNLLTIIDTNDGDSKIVSTTTIPFKNAQARELFVNKNQLILFVEASEESMTFQKYDITPYPSYRQKTVVLFYDITNKKSPALEDQISLTGNYYQSRMINNKIVILSQEYANPSPITPPIIVYKDQKIMPPIYYTERFSGGYMYTTIATIDLDSKKILDDMSLLLGYGTTVMVSEDNIYLAYQKQRNYCFRWYCEDNTDTKDRFFTVVVPLLNEPLRSEMNEINRESLTDDEKWSQIESKLQTFFAQIKEDKNAESNYGPLLENIQDALETYDAEKAIENSKTFIYKIAIDDLSVQTKGEVDGRPINQFSMDEYNTYLRVATTVDIWTQKRQQYNNVYILDADMQIVGSVTNIAENESIYATRFVGDKLFMVTFRQIDPFFVIDLSDPRNPEVVGALKIPGYSSYLHPISDTLIVGVGKETGENQWGGTTTKGVKVSLFDISDFEHPKELNKIEIGEQGSDSAVLYDHKAFLYDNSRKLLSIPVTAVDSRTSKGQYNYEYKVWNGAYLIRIENDSLSTVEKIKHSSSSTQYMYWWNQATVKRSIIIDDYIYTLSDKYLKSTSLNTYTESSSIDLPVDNVYIPIDNTPVAISDVSIGSGGPVVY